MEFSNGSSIATRERPTWDSLQNPSSTAWGISTSSTATGHSALPPAAQLAKRACSNSRLMAARREPVKTGVKWKRVPDRAILVENNVKCPIGLASDWGFPTHKMGESLIRLRSFPS
ncbi:MULTISPECIES: hypothetical protein [unclassified Microcoleus]|uniref:hypothetical protein n=1 Tax=unclassified Microcoleus TaxID=2642155 RepID=UPI002FD44D10